MEFYDMVIKGKVVVPLERVRYERMANGRPRAVAIVGEGQAAHPVYRFLGEASVPASAHPLSLAVRAGAGATVAR